MSVADHPDVGPVAEVILDAIKANAKPGDRPEDIALICIAVASALLVEGSAADPERLPRALERGQAFLESMVDFHVATRTPLGDAVRIPGERASLTAENSVIAFPGARRPDKGGDDDAA